MSDSFTAGENVVCTITAEPKNKAATDTIARLMRRDPEVSRRLRRAQRLRGKRMHSYIRGGKEWFAREKAARVVRVKTGEQWSMPFTHDIAPDLASVRAYVDCKAAG